MTNAAESTFEHDHAPDPRRLKNAAWLPEIRKENIRRALGLEVDEATSSRKRPAKRSLPVDDGSDASSANTARTSAALVLSRRPHSSGQAAQRQAMRRHCSPPVWRAPAMRSARRRARQSSTRTPFRSKRSDSSSLPPTPTLFPARTPFLSPASRTLTSLSPFTA